MRIQFLVSFSLCFLGTHVTGQDIKPMPSSSEDRAEVNYVDISALGIDFDFYNRDTLEIQVSDDLPVWTVHNLHTNEHFNGETDDGIISIRLFRYIQPESGINVFKGIIDDRSNGIIYDIKPDFEGRDTMTTIRPEDLPASGEPQKMDLWTQLAHFNPLRVGHAALNWLGYQTAAMKADVTIDLLVVWSENAECQKSGESVGCVVSATTLANMEADVNAWVAESNTAHSNSNTGVFLNLVHMQRDTTGYVETSSRTALDELRSTNDGALDYIHDLRDTHSADLVHFIADVRRTSPDPVCGLAYISAQGGCTSNANLGFGLTDASCTTAYTPVHEMGHNMGCRHDRGTENACSNICNSNYGFRSPSGNWRTIMAYECVTNECDNNSSNQCSRIPYFSGDATYQGESLGGTENNCRGELQLNKANIAAYR